MAIILLTSAIIVPPSPKASAESINTFFRRPRNKYTTGPPSAITRRVLSHRWEGGEGEAGLYEQLPGAPDPQVVEGFAI